nr:MAG TPA: hypothetical protein [Caudoviricetes sp.]
MAILPMKYQTVIDDLHHAMNRADIRRPVVCKLANIPYITLDKYLRYERSIRNPNIAKRLVLITRVLNTLVDKGALPVPPEMSYHLRSDRVLEIVSEHLNKK